MWPMIAGAAGSALGAWQQQRASQGMAREQMRFQGRQAQLQMDFQERMSSTAHQRQMADLRAAGLNPILAAHGGASSPGGAMGSGAMGQAEDPLGAGVSTAMAVRAHRQELKNMREQEKNLKEERELIKAREYEASAGGHRQYQEATRIRSELEQLLPIQLEQARAQTGLAASNTALNIARLPREESISRLFSSPLATPLAAAIIGGAALTPMRGLMHFRRAGPTGKAVADRLRQTRFPLNLYRRRGAGFR